MRGKLPEFLLSHESDTVILFIHGLAGTYNTWNSFSSALNQSWKGKDCFKLEYDDYYEYKYNIPVYTFLYKAFKGKKINELAVHLNSIVNSVCKKYKNVVLICHSMGGLIARKFIVNKLKDEKNLGNIKGLITYATPHHGSKIANIFRNLCYEPLSFLYIKKFLQIKDLSHKSSFIQELNRDWTNLNVNNKLDFIRVVGLSDRIVSPKSAELEPDVNVFSFANKGHLSIIKPHKKITDGPLMVTYNFLDEFKEKQENRQMLEMGYEEEDKYDY